MVNAFDPEKDFIEDFSANISDPTENFIKGFTFNSIVTAAYDKTFTFGAIQTVGFTKDFPPMQFKLYPTQRIFCLPHKIDYQGIIPVILRRRTCGVKSKYSRRYPL